MFCLCSSLTLIKIKFRRLVAPPIPELELPTKVCPHLLCSNRADILISRKILNNRLRRLLIRLTIISSKDQCFLVSTVTRRTRGAASIEEIVVNRVLFFVCAGWPNDNSNRNQYPRGPYPAAQGGMPNAPPQQWSQGPMPRPPVPNAQPPPNAQWDQHRYPPNSQQQTFPPPQVSVGVDGMVLCS